MENTFAKRNDLLTRYNQANQKALGEQIANFESQKNLMVADMASKPALANTDLSALSRHIENLTGAKSSITPKTGPTDAEKLNALNEKIGQYKIAQNRSALDAAKALKGESNWADKLIMAANIKNKQQLDKYKNDLNKKQAEEEIKKFTTTWDELGKTYKGDKDKFTRLSKWDKILEDGDLDTGFLTGLWSKAAPEDWKTQHLNDFKKLSGEFTLDNMKHLKGAMSEKELKFLEDNSLSPYNTNETNRTIIGIYLKYLKNRTDTAEDMTKYRQKNSSFHNYSPIRIDEIPKSVPKKEIKESSKDEDGLDGMTEEEVRAIYQEEGLGS